jgi:hypothetical protein
MKTATVDGRPVYESAYHGRHDLDFMIRCCVAELEAAANPSNAGLVPAPYCFRRVMVLSRKAKNPTLGEDFRRRYVEALEQALRHYPESDVARALYHEFAGAEAT